MNRVPFLASTWAEEPQGCKATQCTAGGQCSSTYRQVGPGSGQLGVALPARIGGDDVGRSQWQGNAALWRVSWAALCTASICEKPAKYTRHAPRIDAPMAAVRRWLRVAVLVAVCEVLLMIDMARPFQVSG